MKLSFGKMACNNWKPYIFPKPLITDLNAKETGYQQYRWLNFYMSVYKN